MTPWRARSWPKAADLLPCLFAAVAAAAALLAPGATENAVANGDTRTIHLHHAHTQESIDATFMVDGRYDPAVLEKLNWFLRDWRRDEPTHMDPKLFDTIWEVYRESGSQRPVDVMSAYRSPETNAMLRRASRSVAEHSQHILGKAMDQHYEDVPMSRIREIAMRLQRGGVGFYPTAGTPFVHMDVGGVRHWPRMSYDQLSRLFPDGKTVHIPSNGQPLPGYEMARAELEARGDSFDYPTAGEVKSKGFFAWLFGGGDDEGDGEAAREGGAPRDAAPGPRRRGAPQVASQVASLDRAPVGTTTNDAVTNNSKDSGAHLFAFFDAKRAEPPAADPPPAPVAGRRGPKGRAQVASLPPAQPSEAEAQQTLALEMQRQAQAKAQAEAQAAAEDQRVAQARQAAEDQRVAQAQQAALQAQASAELDAPPTPLAPARGTTALLAGAGPVPLPPRRPVELAAVGPAAPVPPSRPGAIPGHSDHAPPPVAALVPPSVRAGLPAAIVQGSGPMAPPRILAFAPPPVATPAPAAVPLPVARPQLVAARLDRSNFRSLTGATLAERLPARIGMGSAVSALRPAAQLATGSIGGDGGSGPRRGFGTRATDLPTDRFSGLAVTPQSRVSTATLRKPRAATADD